MDRSSEALFSLRPVIFRYKPQIDPAGTLQFGLVAEEVETVNPDLVVTDQKGKPYSVRYDQVNAMLLNEFLKEHKRVEAQQSKIEKQEAAIATLNTAVARQRDDFQATVAQQQKDIQALTLTIKKQAGQIQKVSMQVKIGRSAAKVTLNNP
jgi:ATP/maltotriose-dependent transcriptional regulator MalT